jgi:hypothetical protein
MSPAVPPIPVRNRTPVEKLASGFGTHPKTSFLPTDPALVAGPYKFAGILPCCGRVTAIPGKPFYVTNESEQGTGSATVNPGGTLANRKPFAEQGGESLSEDRDGNLYLAAGGIFAYQPAGKLTWTIHVPARPMCSSAAGSSSSSRRHLLSAVRTHVHGAPQHSPVP